MKIIKPQQLGVLTRVYEQKQKCILSIGIFCHVSYETSPQLLTEVSMWKLVANVMGKNAILDMGIPKAQGEVLLCATCYPPNPPASECAVRLKLANIDKTLLVFGAREWQSFRTHSDPLPFSKMPLTYENAYGGPEYDFNPVGKGHRPVQMQDTIKHSLPNIEAPGARVRAPDVTTMPAGFGPYEFTWPQRQVRRGRFDQHWLTKEYPGFPSDQDPLLFNAAPPDQWLSSYLKGDETFLLQNMHPTEPNLEARLPEVSTRCFVTRKTKTGNLFHEVPTHLETLWLFPDAMRAILLFRGVQEISEDDASDVLHLLMACEEMRSPKSAEHYELVLKQRLDHETAHLHALREQDLLPESLSDQTLSSPDDDALASVVAHDNLLRKNLRRRLEQQYEQARERFKAQGLDPDKHLKPLEPEEAALTSPTELLKKVDHLQSMSAQKKLELDTRVQEAKQAFKTICQQHGIESDAILNAPKGALSFNAAQTLKDARQSAQSARRHGQPNAVLETFLADPSLEARLQEGEQKLRILYKRNAQHFPALASLNEEKSNELRRQVEHAAKTRQSLSGVELTGADLSALDLSHLNLEGALMEGTNLSHTNLRHARLAGAVLVRASLEDTDLRDADLSGANLSQARLMGTRLEGAVMTDAILEQAALSSVQLRGAHLHRVQLMQTTMQNVSLQEVRAEQLFFHQNVLRRLDFGGSSLTKCVFSETSLDDVSFERATLDSIVFLKVKGNNTSFRRARTVKLQLVNGCHLPGADFREAFLEGANLRGTELSNAQFQRALLQRADFSECILSGANFHQSVASEASFIRATLTDARMTDMGLRHAILQKSTLSGADFTGAQLFRADLMRAVFNSRTKLSQADLSQARTFHMREDHG